MSHRHGTPFGAPSGAPSRALAGTFAAVLFAWAGLAAGLVLGGCSTDESRQGASSSAVQSSSSTSSHVSGQAGPAAAAAAAPRQGIRGSSGETDTVVVRRSTGHRTEGQTSTGDLSLVAGCGETKYDTSGEVMAAPAECDTSSESHEAR